MVRIRIFLLLSATWVLELSPKEIAVIFLYSKYSIFINIFNELIITVKPRACSCSHFWRVIATFILKGHNILPAISFGLLYSTTVMFIFYLGVRQNLYVDMIQKRWALYSHWIIPQVLLQLRFTYSSTFAAGKNIIR